MDSLHAGRPYVYSTLPSPTHTRLLELQPSQDRAAELRCRIHVVDLYDPEIVFYEAISYTWGKPVFSHALWIDDDENGPTQLLVTANLSEALCRFRRHTEPRFIWADAICICQRDDAEKSTHIPLMTDIYRGASRVLAWLGGGQAEEQALSRINVLGRLIHSQAGAPSSSHRQELSKSILDLLRMPWFSRRWIIQEVVMNLDVVIFCGSQQSSFLRLAQSYIWSLSIERSPLARTAGLMAIFDLWNWWALKQGEEGSRCLLRLLRDFDHFGCADGKDRIFTLAALSTDVRLHTIANATPPRSLESDSEPGIIVDYSASVEDVYVSTALTIVNSGHLEWVLGQVVMRSGAVGTAALPSWVPDWRDPIQHRSVLDLDHITPLRRTSAHCNMWKLANANAYLLRAKFTYVEHWQPRNPEPFSDRYWFPKSSLEKHAVAPMAITWRHECFPDIADTLETLPWVISTFSKIWERVLSSLTEAQSIPKFDMPKQRAWDECVDRFTRVITAGGKHFEHLDPAQRNLIRLCDSPKHDQKDADMSNLTPNESGNPDLIQNTRDSPNDLESREIGSIIRDILLGTPQNLSYVNQLLALVAITMKDRCLFTCEVDWKPEYALAADIMGIGVSRLKEDDRIMALPSHFSNVITSWAEVIVVREATLDVDAIDDAINEVTKEHGRCNRQEFPPPVYEFVGDCFLATAPHELRTRGLMEKRWDVKSYRDRDGWGSDDYVEGCFDDRNSGLCDYDVIIV